jgi:hypothetical protein
MDGQPERPHGAADRRRQGGPPHHVLPGGGVRGLPPGGHRGQHDDRLRLRLRPIRVSVPVSTFTSFLARHLRLDEISTALSCGHLTGK